MSALKANYVTHFELLRPVIETDPIVELQSALNPVLASHCSELYNQRGHGRRNRELLLPRRGQARLVIGDSSCVTEVDQRRVGNQGLEADLSAFILSSITDTQSRFAKRLVTASSTAPLAIEFGYEVDDMWARQEYYEMATGLQEFGLRLNQRDNRRCFIPLAKIPDSSAGAESIMQTLEDYMPSELQLGLPQIMAATVRRLRPVRA